MFIYEYGDKNDCGYMAARPTEYAEEIEAFIRRRQNVACPPERWTPGGEDPETHYRALLEFYKQHYSPRTIYTVFWSTDNYSMPNPVPRVDTKIEYWYGEEEKRAREKEHDIEFVSRTYPQTVFREFKGLAHAELVMMFPERFAREVKRFLEK